MFKFLALLFVVALALPAAADHDMHGERNSIHFAHCGSSVWGRTDHLHATSCRDKYVRMWVNWRFNSRNGSFETFVSLDFGPWHEISSVANLRAFLNDPPNCTEAEGIMYCSDGEFDLTDLQPGAKGQQFITYGGDTVRLVNIATTRAWLNTMPHVDEVNVGDVFGDFR